MPEDNETDFEFDDDSVRKPLAADAPNERYCDDITLSDAPASLRDEAVIPVSSHSMTVNLEYDLPTAIAVLLVAGKEGISQGEGEVIAHAEAEVKHMIAESRDAADDRHKKQAERKLFTVRAQIVKHIPAALTLLLASSDDPDITEMLKSMEDPGKAAAIYDGLMHLAFGKGGREAVEPARRLFSRVRKANAERDREDAAKHEGRLAFDARANIEARYGMLQENLPGLYWLIESGDVPKDGSGFNTCSPVFDMMRILAEAEAQGLPNTQPWRECVNDMIDLLQKAAKQPSSMEEYAILAPGEESRNDGAHVRFRSQVKRLSEHGWEDAALGRLTPAHPVR